MCIRYGHGNGGEGVERAKERKMRLATRSRLRGWYTGTYAEIFNTKRGHMDKTGFEDIIVEFTQSLRD